MTVILKKVEAASKEEIVRLIAEHYKVLDQHLELMGEGIGTREGKLWDLTGVDKDKRLVLISVELRYTDKLLFHLVNRIDWAWEHLESITKMYPSYKIHSDQIPHALIVAPSYPPSFKKCISYLTYRVKISLFSYTHVESGAGRGILLEPVETRARYEYTLKDETKYMPSLEVAHDTKVTTEEIMEFLH